MFKVTRKEDNKSFDVYNIRYDPISGYPQFLIYDENHWVLISAKLFKPFEDKRQKLLEDID